MGKDYEYMIANADKGPFSMTFNGLVIDDYITNLVIENVEGRDTVSSELYEHTYGRYDGARYRFRRHEPKELTVTYVILSDTYDDHRDTLNTLRGVLYGPETENAKIIFADEPDKFWIGTVSNITEERILYNDSSRGTITIRLSRPFKYDINETVVTPQVVNGSPVFIVNYEGTYNAFPTITATFPTENVPAGDELTNNGDCGFIAFVNQNGKVLQFGDPDETDLDSKSTSTTLVNQKFNIWDYNASKNWITNQSARAYEDCEKFGSMNKVTQFQTDLITPTTFGTGEKWHGPCITYEIPNNNVTDFTFEMGLVFATGGTPETAIDIKEELGILKAMVENDNGTLAELRITKNSGAANKGVMTFHVAGEEKFSKELELGTYNETFGWKKPDTTTEPVRQASISRKGDILTFTVGETTETYSLTNENFQKAKYVTFYLGSFGTKYPLGSLGMTSIKFASDHWATGQNMKNKFGSNDVCVVDCENAEVLLNNTPTPSLGAVGNQWEEFYLRPGLNQIGITWSSWVVPANNPTFTLKYRKAYL